MSKSLLETVPVMGKSGFTSNTRGVLGYSKCMDEKDNPAILKVLRDDHRIPKSHEDYLPYRVKQATDFPTQWTNSESGFTHEKSLHTPEARIEREVKRSLANDRLVDKCGEPSQHYLTEFRAAYNQPKCIGRLLPNMPFGRVRTFNTGFTRMVNPLGDPITARILDPVHVGAPPIPRRIMSTYSTGFLPKKILTGNEFIPRLQEVAVHQTAFSKERNVIAPFADADLMKTTKSDCNKESKTSYENDYKEKPLLSNYIGGNEGAIAFKFGNEDQLKSFMRGSVDFRTTYTAAFYDRSPAAIGREGYLEVLPTRESAYSKNNKFNFQKSEHCPTEYLNGVDDRSSTSNAKFNFRK